MITFDIFKGRKNKNRQVVKIRNVGCGYYSSKWGHFELQINGLAQGGYALKAETDVSAVHDYVIYYKTLCSNSPKQVGVGYLLRGDNAGLIRMEWDFYDSKNIYIDLKKHKIKKVAA